MSEGTEHLGYVIKTGEAGEGKWTYVIRLLNGQSFEIPELLAPQQPFETAEAATKAAMDMIDDLEF